MMEHIWKNKKLQFELLGEEDASINRDFNWILQETFDMPTYEGIDFRGRMVLDCGAYYGETAVLFSLLGASQVYCIEPGFASLYISKNASHNSRYNIVPVRAAVTKDGDPILVKDIAPIGCARLGDITSKDGKGRLIMTHTLSELVHMFLLEDAVLKMDIEGMEYEIIEDAAPEVLRKFKYMAIETNRWYAGDDRHLQLKKKLEQCGFRWIELATLPQTFVTRAERID